MTLALTVMLIAGIAVPHLLRLGSASPAVAAMFWLSALCLRALTVLYLALYLVLFLPNTQLFAAVTHWCWHTVLPLLATHLGLDGHRIGDAAVIFPAFALTFSVVSVAVGVIKAARSVRDMLARSSLGAGPGDSMMVSGRYVLLAAAGITRPRVFVSAGALTTLDDAELAAGLEHERAHIARRHRFILVFAELCRGLARFLPGTAKTLAELHFHLERDADHWALARRHDPYALASAICKAATSHTTPAPSFVLLSGQGAVTRRVDELIELGVSKPPRALKRVLACAAAVMACFTLVLAASVPATVLAATSQPKLDQPRHCDT